MLTLHPTLKKYLIISAKHAVNALLTNAGLAAMWPGIFNLHFLGIVAMLKAAALVIGSRELMVWGPRLLKWSQDGLEINGGTPPPQV